MEGNNVKVLYRYFYDYKKKRRGNAYMNLNQFDEAEADFKRIMELDPQNVEAKKDLETLKTKKAAQK